MKQAMLFMLVILFINHCLCQKGFPKQFQATLNVTGITTWRTGNPGVQQLLYDYENLRVRMDIKGWTQQDQTYMINYKPKGAEADSPASEGYTIFNFNPDSPELAKNTCAYRTEPMSDTGPFPSDWFYGSQGHTEIKPWFPLPKNLINQGEEWIPELQMLATRYDSPEICNLQQSGIGKVPCLSYFETESRPVKTITAYGARLQSYESDEYVSTFYLKFNPDISSKAAHLFDLPKLWPVKCGNANAGFTGNSGYIHVFKNEGQDNFTLQLQTPPVHALGDRVKVDFKIHHPTWLYNGTRCAKFNPIVFDRKHWDEPVQVEMSFVDYGCCTYEISAQGGGYDWQYSPYTFVVYACDGEPGSGCKDGKYLCEEWNTQQ